MTQAEPELKKLFDRHSSAVAIVRKDFTIIGFNGIFCRLTDFTVSELDGRKITELFGPLSMPLLQGFLDKTGSADSDMTSMETTVMTKSGSVRYCLLTAGYFEAEEHILMVLVDITERRTAELQLREQVQKQKKALTIQENQMAIQTTQLALHDEHYKHIFSELHKIRSLGTGNNKEQIALIDSLLKELDGWQKSFTWSRMNERYVNLHPAMVDNLLTKHPGLTPSEIKLCILLTLLSDTKEVAAVTNQTHDSVRVSRTRLRKKLGLESGQNLVTYLLQF